MPQIGVLFHSIPLLRSILKSKMWMTMPRWPRNLFIILLSWKTLQRMYLSFRSRLRIQTLVPMKNWHTGLQVGILRIFLPSISKQVRGCSCDFWKLIVQLFKSISLTFAYSYYFIYLLINFIVWQKTSSFLRVVSEKVSSLLVWLVCFNFSWYHSEVI